MRLKQAKEELIRATIRCRARRVQRTTEAKRADVESAGVDDARTPVQKGPWLTPGSWEWLRQPFFWPRPLPV